MPAGDEGSVRDDRGGDARPDTETEKVIGPGAGPQPVFAERHGAGVVLDVEEGRIDAEFGRKIDISPTLDIGIIESDPFLAADVARNPDAGPDEAGACRQGAELREGLGDAGEDLGAVGMGGKPDLAALHGGLGEVDEHAVEVSRVEIEPRVSPVTAAEREETARTPHLLAVLDPALADEPPLDHAVDAATRGRLGDGEFVGEVASRDFLRFADFLDDERFERGRIHGTPQASTVLPFCEEKVSLSGRQVAVPRLGEEGHENGTDKEEAGEAR